MDRDLDALIEKNRSVCKGCRAPIVFARTERGGTMPVNRAPGVDGTVELVRMPSSGGDQLIAMVVGKKVDGVMRYVPHFVDCPQADKFRRGR